MKASVSQSMIEDFETIVLENQYLRAVIIPELGGRVWELEDRIRGRQWIWHREDVPLQAVPMGAVYDEVWAGGWEELFPNDAPGIFEGRELPDHGEWWTLRWKVLHISNGASATVRLGALSSVMKTECIKEFRLADESSTLSVGYHIRSIEAQPFNFLFKQHLPVNLTPGCRLLLPGGRVEAVDSSFSTLLPGSGPFNWPLAGEKGRAIDLRNIPLYSDRLREFVYVRDLPQSWCGVEDERQGASIRMDFDFSKLPFVWLFLSYGGWRNVYTAVLEPCTNMPKDLSEAVRLKQSARLEPGQEFKTTVSVTLSGRLGTAL
jgi:hypothetical protein